MRLRRSHPTKTDLTPVRVTLRRLAFVALGLGPLLWFACTAPPRGTGPTVTAAAPVAAIPPLDAGFRATVHPFVETYCVGCHGGKKPEAQLDLSTYTSLAAVTKDARRWGEVLERIEAREMPPEDAEKIPTATQRQPVVDWIKTMRDVEIQRTAGDPGVVLARRLSNAEYDNTIRDLTGVDLRPTKEFPVDPANAAGFDNSGESLAMSPALVKKYLDAARAVADHLLFKPDGLAFAPFPVVTDEDRDRYAVRRIVDFYQRQGLGIATRFATYRAQSLDYTGYFIAAWRFSHRGAVGRPEATLADCAKEAGLSPKYLGKIWEVLTLAGEESGPIAAIQSRWRELPPPVAGREPAAIEPACRKIHGFIADLRPFVAEAIANPPARGVAAGSQTLVLWKDRQYATRRMTYPGNAQDVDMDYYAQSDPLMLIPRDEAQLARYEESFKKFCAVFPDAFAVAERARTFLNPNTQQGAREISTDLQGHRLLTAGFHSQMGYFRDDAPLCELVLDAAQNRELDTLWQELDFIALVPFRQFRQFIWFERAEPPSFMLSAEFNAFRAEDDDMISAAKVTQLGEAYAAKARKLALSATAQQAIEDYFPAMNRAIRALEQARREAEPRQLEALVDFAGRASRRPLTPAERADLLEFYHALRQQPLSHEDAIRDSVVSVLMSPAFCYRFDLPGPAAGTTPAAVQPLGGYELASRLSYFLWSSMPDRELLAHAAAGDLRQPAVLVAQARRLLQDDRVRALATEFGGNWLDIRRFEEHNAVDRERFPAFTNDLRAAMFEEPVHFFVDLVRRNGSVLDFVYGEHTFVNPVLARHYGMPVPEGGPDAWVRVDDARNYQRGGLLPMAAFLTKNAPGLRTSPVKRGHWVVTRLLGERIPAPPPNVPVLPTDETKLGDLTLRQTLAQHRADKSCASCHNKFDSLGLVFEGFGPVGEVRTTDLAGRPAETGAVFPDGSEGAGLAGLQAYFHGKVEGEFLDNLCRKLLVYALGRSLLPSDDLVVAAMRQKLATGGNRFDNLVEEIVTSRQFLSKRRSPGNETD